MSTKPMTQDEVRAMIDAAHNPKTPPTGPMFESLIIAAAHGKNAFERGAKRVAAQDPAFSPLLRGRTPREAMRLMDAWYAAWDHENMAS